MKNSYKFRCFQDKDIRVGLERFSLKKCKNFMQYMLPNEEKSDIKTYQNTQICYERETYEKNSSEKKLPGSLLVHYILEDFPEVFQNLIQI